MTIIEEHGDALEYDLLTKSHHRLTDVPDVLDWWSLGAFVRYLPADSALNNRLNPDTANWEGTRRLPMLLADVFDNISALHYTVSRGLGSKAKKPKPYPRPNAKAERKYGAEPIQIQDFDKWWNNN